MCIIYVHSASNSIDWKCSYFEFESINFKIVILILMNAWTPRLLFLLFMLLLMFLFIVVIACKHIIQLTVLFYKLKTIIESNFIQSYLS